MTPAEFLKKLKTKLAPSVWRRLRGYAKSGVIRWGEFSHYSGPGDGKGG